MRRARRRTEPSVDGSAVKRARSPSGWRSFAGSPLAGSSFADSLFAASLFAGSSFDSSVMIGGGIAGDLNLVIKQCIRA
jgi:hypothetical protein